MRKKKVFVATVKEHKIRWAQQPHFFLWLFALPLTLALGVEARELTLAAREVWAVEALLLPLTALSCLFCDFVRDTLHQWVCQRDIP